VLPFAKERGSEGAREGGRKLRREGVSEGRGVLAREVGRERAGEGARERIHLVVRVQDKLAHTRVAGTCTRHISTQ
jgi:hypothetical protein